MMALYYLATARIYADMAGFLRHDKAYLISFSGMVLGTKPSWSCLPAPMESFHQNTAA